MVDTEYRRGDQITQHRRYYISSLQENAEQILHAVRTHWQVENSLNWVLDVAFREDDSRIRKEAGVSTGWERWVGERGKVIGWDHFGASAPSDVLAEKFGFTVKHVLQVAKSLMTSR